VGLVERDRVGQDEIGFGHTSGAGGHSLWGHSVWSCVGPGRGHEWFLSLSPRLAVFNAPFSSLSLDLIHS
jgi:hypothetical protein